MRETREGRIRRKPLSPPPQSAASLGDQTPPAMEDGDDEPFNPFADPDGGLPFDIDLDLADLDGGRPAPVAAKPVTKFQPKLKGKLLKPEPSVEHSSSSVVVPANTNALSLPAKQEDGTVVKKEEAVWEGASSSGARFMVKKEEGTSDGELAPMDVDGDMGEEEEDVVVREIDVFFNPSPLDTDTQLYVMQYPLRSSWRPYELDDRCQEVRVKPKHSKIEFDLSMNVDSENYDNQVDEPLRLQKQVLSSSKVPFVTGYAVGILVGNQLHLNPVHAIMQLRPSMAHVEASGAQKRKHIAQSAGSSAISDDENAEESGKPSVDRGKQVPEASSENTYTTEAWVSLEYHAVDSPISSTYQEKMVVEESSHIQFSMNPYDYLNLLCPGTSADNRTVKGPSRRILLSMPLEERLKMLFSEGPQVHRFDALMHVAPIESVDDVLKLLQQHAYLVQGLWVSKSSLLYEGFQAVVRDYILFLFNKKNTIPNDKIKTIKLPNEILKRIISPLAFERSAFKDWKFKEPTDLSFIKRHPKIVRDQENLWTCHQERIKDVLRGAGKNLPAMTKNSVKSDMPGRAATVGSVDQGAKRGEDATLGPGTTTMSDETREALPKALIELFNNHKVCSINLIRQGLREMAVSKASLPKADARTFVAAAHGASAPLTELEAIIFKVAEKLHDVYVLKSLDPKSLRSVVITLLRGRPRNEKLKRAEINEAAKLVLQKDFLISECTQVLNEFCVSNRGAWVLKSGDGKPK